MQKFARPSVTWALGTGFSILFGAVAASTWKENYSRCLESPRKTFDVAVIGGGVVGLAVARECAVRGRSVVLIEKEDAVAAGASSGNSGIGCTGYDAPVGSLERKLLRRSIRLHQNLYRSFGLSHEHVRKSGSLVVAWNAEQLAQLPVVLEENREAGDLDARILSKEELSTLEPSLAKTALGAVFCPFEAVVEPWLVPIGYAESARLHGANLLMNRRVSKATFDAKDRAWELQLTETVDSSVGRSLHGSVLVNEPLSRFNHQSLELPQNKEIIHGKVVINCAGLFGDDVEVSRGNGNPGFHVTPRKGQFVVFKPRDRSTMPTCIVEQVATQFTKGVIVWATVYGNIIVGPTAVDQDSRTDRTTDMKTANELVKFGKSVLPILADAEVIGTYSGLRPATEHRDYQISSDKEKQWITVAGIRSTGLTASSGIGEYVADLHENILDPTIEPWAESTQHLLGVSESASSPLPLPKNVVYNQPVPSLEELAKDFEERKDGTVKVYGRIHRVTHPISSFGMETLATKAL